MYVAEIVPPAETAVEAFKSLDTANIETGNTEPGIGIVRGYIMRAAFSGLKTSVHYRIKISTIVNGKTICQVSEEIADYDEKFPVRIMKFLWWDVEIATTT